MVLTGLGIAGDTDASARLVEDLDDLVDEVVDDLYVRGFAQQTTLPEFSRTEAGAIATTVTLDPQARIEPATITAGPAAARKVSFAQRGPRRVRPAQAAAAACSATTTCSASWPKPWPTRPRRPASGCGSAGGWCSSTSSRTPTPCSGRCSTARSPGTRRWCSSATPSRRSTPSAVATCPPTWRPPTRRHGTRPSTSTTAATPDSSSGCKVCWSAPSSATPNRRAAGPRSTPGGAARRRPASRALPAARRRPHRGSGRHRDETLAVGRLRPVVAADLADDVVKLLTSGATFEGRPLEARRRRRHLRHPRQAGRGGPGAPGPWDRQSCSSAPAAC